MKQQRTLNQMASELTRQAEHKRDYVASTHAMRVDFTSTPQKRLNIDGKVDESLVVAEHAHRQLAQRLSIPWKFYGRMLDDHPSVSSVGTSAGNRHALPSASWPATAVVTAGAASSTMSDAPQTATAQRM